MEFLYHVEGSGEESLRAACELNMEGIIGKKADSLYTGSRNGDWIKLKCSKQQEFIIGGYSQSEKKARAISSLLLGLYDSGKLVYVGRAGSGLSDGVIKDLEEKFRTIRVDPDEGMDLEQVRQGARDLREILNELSLDSYIKTSGGKGYHVVVPLKPTATWDTFYTFAKSVAEVMEKKWPNRYTTNSRKAKRSGKIFIDWMRNGRGATSVAPYSLRAREGAAVSMPITWEELDSIASDGVSMHLALQRILTDDPWEGFFNSDSYLA